MGAGPTLWEECCLEHPHKLVNIHPMHLTRMVTLFLSSQSEGPLKMCMNASTSVFSARLASVGFRVYFQVLGYLETGPYGQCQFPWFPLWKGCSFGALACLWNPSEKMALSLEVLSPLRARFGRISKREKHRSGTFGSRLSAAHRLGAQGTGSEQGFTGGI